jgi:hypothetical protein
MAEWFIGAGEMSNASKHILTKLLCFHPLQCLSSLMSLTAIYANTFFFVLSEMPSTLIVLIKKINKLFAVFYTRKFELISPTHQTIELNGNEALTRCHQGHYLKNYNDSLFNIFPLKVLFILWG